MKHKKLQHNINRDKL